MSNLVEYRQPESAHWYRGDGAPAHDADLRKARKERLFPSVTSVLAIKEKPQLTSWKIGQMVAQALTMTRNPGESDYMFIKRVEEADKAERAKAPDLGTAVHAELARYVTTHTAVNIDVDMKPVLAWIDEHLIVPERCECRFCNDILGFGGCIDYVGVADGRPALIDWKSQNVKKAPAFYDEWSWQLAAYREGIIANAHDCYSVIIDTAHPGCYVKKWEEEELRIAWRGFKGLLEAWFADRHYFPVEFAF